MKLSVVIPTYNRKDSLRLTLDGLARQTYPMEAFEVIVVSDGSADGTIEMLRDYAEAASYRLHPIQQENSGPSAARNRGIREAQHEIVVFLDDDVEPVPEFLARHASHHDIDEKIVVLGPMSPDPARRAQEPVWIAWEHAKLQETYNLFRSGGKYAGRNPSSMHFYSGNASVRWQWLKAVDGFDEAFKRQEDVEMAARMQRACGVRFVWDFAADGLHRPVRTFDSWLRIPKAYGTLDAERILSGSLTAEKVESGIQNRNPATQLLTRACLTSPWLLPFIAFLCKMAAFLFYQISARKIALGLLSSLYNTCYAHALRNRLILDDARSDRKNAKQSITI